MNGQARNKLTSLVQRRLQVERRRVKRFVPCQRTLCVLQAPGEDGGTSGSVQNLSVKGVGLLAEREYPPGTSLRLLLVNAPHTFALTVDMQVARCFRAANGQYFLGGPFGRDLCHDEVVPFVL